MHIRISVVLTGIVHAMWNAGSENSAYPPFGGAHQELNIQHCFSTDASPILLNRGPDEPPSILILATAQNWDPRSIDFHRDHWPLGAAPKLLSVISGGAMWHSKPPVQHRPY